MNLLVQIRRNEDGAVAEDLWPDWSYNRFWWEEGSGSCDCNRRAFFHSARSEDFPDDIPCSEGKFSVRLTDFDTKTVIYDEL